MSARARAPISAALCCALAVASLKVARAEPPPASVGQEERAVALYELARTHFEAGDPAAALAAIDLSLASFDSPNSQLLRAHVLRALGRKADAMRAYQSAQGGAKRRFVAGELRFEPTVAESGKWMGVLGAALAEIDITVAGSSPALRVLVGGVPVVVERRENGEVAASVWMDPGSLTIETTDGKMRQSRSVSATAGSSQRVLIDLRPKPVGRPIQASEGGLPPAGTWVAASVGVAGMTLFGVLGGLALSIDAELEASCSPACPLSRIDEAERGERYQIGANVSAAIGATGFVVGAVIWLVDAATSDAGDPGAALRAGPRGLVVRF